MYMYVFNKEKYNKFNQSNRAPHLRIHVVFHAMGVLYILHYNVYGFIGPMIELRYGMVM